MYCLSSFFLGQDDILSWIGNHVETHGAAFLSIGGLLDPPPPKEMRGSHSIRPWLLKTSLSGWSMKMALQTSRKGPQPFEWLKWVY